MAARDRHHADEAYPIRAEATGTVHISQEDAWCASASKVRVHAVAAGLAALRQHASTRDYDRPVSCARAGVTFGTARGRQASLCGYRRA